jgi:hypothetical protein
MNPLGRLSHALVLSLCLGVAGFGLWSSTTPTGTAQAAEKKERHPHIHAAIKELKDAKKDLKEADHDFGGHRVKAIEAIDHAIEQLEKCLKHDKK